MVVAAVKPDSHLVLMSATDFARTRREQKASGAWAFYLRSNNGRTRLIIRGSGSAVGNPLFDIAHFVMEQKMMRGIRSRVHETRRRSSSLDRGLRCATRLAFGPRRFIRTRRYDQSESVARGVIIDLLPSPVTLRSCGLRVL